MLKNPKFEALVVPAAGALLGYAAASRFHKPRRRMKHE